MDTRRLAAMRFRIRWMESVKLLFFAQGYGSKSDRCLEAFAKCCPQSYDLHMQLPPRTMISVIDFLWVRDLYNSGLICFVAETVADFSLNGVSQTRHTLCAACVVAVRVLW